jgi:hypothetical protein
MSIDGDSGVLRNVISKHNELQLNTFHNFASSLRSVCVLSFRLYLGLPNDLFPRIFQIDFWETFYVYDLPIRRSLIWLHKLLIFDPIYVALIVFCFSSTGVIDPKTTLNLDLCIFHVFAFCRSWGLVTGRLPFRPQREVTKSLQICFISQESGSSGVTLVCNFIQEQHTIKLESCYATYTGLCNSILMLIPLINPRCISSQYVLIDFQTLKISLRKLKKISGWPM